MNLIPFESNTLPAHINTGAKVMNPFAMAAGGGFPVVSIKGKAFHIVRGDERTLVMSPTDPDAPASAIEVVILHFSPTLNKVFYPAGYTEGSADKPLCYSTNSAEPAADAAEPQAKKCALCPHNAWGSGTNDKGEPTKGKACSDNVRMAVAPAGQLNDPMLLRVPAASLKTLGQYGDVLAKRGVEPHQVVTKIGFDYTVAHPALTFKPVGFVTDAMLEEIMDTRDTAIVGQIIGTTPTAVAAPAQAEGSDTPAPAEPAKATRTRKPKEEKAPQLAAAEAEAAAAPKAPVKVEPEPVKVASAATLQEELESLDFDD